MKKLLLILFAFAFVTFFPISQTFSHAQTQKEIIINTNYTQVYGSPSFDDLYEFTFEQNTILKLEEEIDNFYKVKYFVETLGEINCYIPIEFASIYKEPQEMNITYNGKVLVESQILSINDNSIMEGVKLQKDHEIFLYDGFNSKEEYNEIKFEYDEKILTGKILTTNIVPNGINKTLIIALSAIISLVGIILLLMGLKTRKKKKKKNMA